LGVGWYIDMTMRHAKGCFDDVQHDGPSNYGEVNHAAACKPVRRLANIYGQRVSVQLHVSIRMDHSNNPTCQA